MYLLVFHKVVISYRGEVDQEPKGKQRTSVE